MPNCQKNYFQRGGCRTVEFSLCLHVILHQLSKFCTNQPKWRRNIEPKIFNMASDRHLDFKDFRLTEIG